MKSEQKHYCTSYREGDWIIWRCPVCVDYERRLNLSTGEMIVHNKTQGYTHIGVSNKNQNLEGLTHNISDN